MTIHWENKRTYEPHGTEHAAYGAHLVELGISDWCCGCHFCSDGLWGLLQDDEAAQIVTPHADNPQAAAEALMAEVSRRGGRDNASVIVASWGGGAARP